jgi:hypothetical protein
MLVKRVLDESVLRDHPRGSRGMAKARLLEVQSRSVASRPTATLTQRGVTCANPMGAGAEQDPQVRYRAVEPGSRDEWTACNHARYVQT